MQQSKIIEVNGVFLGAAVALPHSAGWQFVAADARAGSADGLVGKTYQDTQALARQAFCSSAPAADLQLMVEQNHLPNSQSVRQPVKPFIDVIQRQPVRQQAIHR